MKILVTGGTGFLGHHLQNNQKHNKNQFFYASSKDCDLRNQNDVNAFFSKHRFDKVIHLAASVGGIGANQCNPGKFCYENLIMGCNVIESSRITDVKKIVVVGTVCSYPNICEVPFKEKNLWNGYPEVTNAPYGIAKKVLLELLKGYKMQYDLDYTFLIPVNMYGEHDNFDPDSSHVIPALIDKILEAKHNNLTSIEVWGTGKATREFVHAKDVSVAITKALDTTTDTEAINVGSGEEISIEKLVEKISRISGWTGKIKYLSTKPDGQPRRLIDSKRAYDILQYKPKINLDHGLKN